jgi:hypothetical protein
MTGLKPYQVWCKQHNEWRCLYSSHNPTSCRDFALYNIHHGNNVQRIELRDLEGPLETFYDATWGQDPSSLGDAT